MTESPKKVKLIAVGCGLIGLLIGVPLLTNKPVKTEPGPAGNNFEEFDRIMQPGAVSQNTQPSAQSLDAALGLFDKQETSQTGPPGETHTVKEVFGDGKFLLLDDGTLLKSDDRLTTKYWRGDDILVSDSEALHTGDNEKVDVNKVDDVTGYTFLEVATMPETFHGADRDKFVKFGNGLVLQFDEHKYGYAYNPETAIFADGRGGFRLLIEDDFYQAKAPSTTSSSEHNDTAYGTTNPNYHYVSPTIRSDGTLVEGHFQTDPNETKLDNWSTKGNINPFTGQEGTVEP